MVINASLSDTISSANIPNNRLVPHSSSTQYYVAAVLSDNEYNHNEPFVLGNESITEFEGSSYVNAPITIGDYRYFVRAYTIGPVSQFILYSRKIDLTYLLKN